MIYIISGEPLPYGMAATNRIINYAKSLMLQGHECRLLACVRTESQYRPINNAQREDVFEGVPFRYIPQSTIRSRHFIVRRIEDAYDWVNSLIYIYCHIKRGDVVHLFVGATAVFESLVLLIARIKGFKVTKELCEMPASTRNDSWIARVKRWVELHWVFPKFDGVVAISKGLEDIAKQYSSKRAKIIKVPILVDSNDGLLADAYVHPRPYILHCGTMTERKDGIISTMKAFAIACKKLNGLIDFILSGSKSGLYEELLRIINENGIGDNVIFLGTVDRETLRRYQRGASLCVINKNDNLQNRYNFSTKLGEILISETPVITTTVGEANNFLKDGVSAYITEPHKPELIAEEIVRAFSDEPLRQKIAKAGRQVAIDNFTIEIQGKRLAEYFDNL